MDLNHKLGPTNHVTEKVASALKGWTTKGGRFHLYEIKIGPSNSFSHSFQLPGFFQAHKWKAIKVSRLDTRLCLHWCIAGTNISMFCNYLSQAGHSNVKSQLHFVAVMAGPHYCWLLDSSNQRLTRVATKNHKLLPSNQTRNTCKFSLMEDMILSAHSPLWE